MCCSARRWVIGAVVLFAGITWLSSSSEPMEAAEPSDDAIKAIAEQDIKNIQELVAKGTFTKAEVKALRSNTLMLAVNAQSLLGKKADQDAKLATMRDQAMKIALVLDSGKKSEIKKLEDSAKALKWLPDTDASAKVAKIDIAKVGSFAIEELMYQYRDTKYGGLNIEADIKALAKAKKLSADDLKKIATFADRTAIITHLSDTITPSLPSNAKKADWAKFNAQMKDATKELQDAARGTDGTKIIGALGKVDTSCTNCHNVFKK